MTLIKDNMKMLNALCEKHKVDKLFVFGSVLTDKFNADSDVDFVVNFEGIDVSDYADNYFDFKNSLQALFNRPVDLVEDKSIQNPVFRRVIDRTKQLVYGRES
ncbi:MAG: nucleotidyltransferase domain-containing protein [Bacteroidaceae bacterium]|nr:nucleotidyltransferase domain-containing protein [Bacteroidaceae bacterium]